LKDEKNSQPPSLEYPKNPRGGWIFASEANEKFARRDEFQRMESNLQKQAQK